MMQRSVESIVESSKIMTKAGRKLSCGPAEILVEGTPNAVESCRVESPYPMSLRRLRFHSASSDKLILLWKKPNFAEHKRTRARTRNAL